jgi:hypothetical protein
LVLTFSCQDENEKDDTRKADIEKKPSLDSEDKIAFQKMLIYCEEID